MLAIILIMLAVGSRLLVHAPNLTPIVAVALFSGVYLNKRLALIVPLAVMIISDSMLGWHSVMLWTWGSMVLCVGPGFWLRRHRSVGSIFGMGFVSALIFFVVTNFGAWLTMYPHTWQGLVNCYTAAIPFFRNTLTGTMVYGAALFGIYEGLALWLRQTSWGKCVLSPVHSEAQP